MQLFARDSSGCLVSATHAIKQHNYVCLECQGTVRLRFGEYRHPHFYHLTPPSHCRQTGKTLEHLQVQYYLQHLLCGCDLEYPFEAINRIADVAWHTHKVVFEIQCSSICAEEVRARNADYASLGYSVVWVLHQQQFWRERPSAAEMWVLRQGHYYFTDMDEQGNGCIYDRLILFRDGIRQVLSNKLPVQLNEQHSMPKTKPYHAHRAYYFAGDVCDKILKGVLAAPITPQEPRSHIPWWYTWIAHPYRVAFQFFLERACR
jgi:competence protein CoiA